MFTKLTTLVLAPSKANANACSTWAQDLPLEPHLEFRRTLSMTRINNSLDDDGNNKPVVETFILWYFTHHILTDHSLETWPLYANRWKGSKLKLLSYRKIPN